jgi:hypothetical protein
MLFGSQQPETAIAYPAGIAALIKGGQGFQVVSHYLNVSTTETIHATVTLTLTKAKAGSSNQHAGVFFLNNVSALTQAAGGGIPPHTKKTITAQWKTPRDLNLLTAVGHMHQRTVSLTAMQGADMLYTTDSWDNAPLAIYDPVKVVPAGSTIQWSCVVDNDTDETLIFGESAKTNEMCIFDGQYFPVADDAQPSILVTR